MTSTNVPAFVEEDHMPPVNEVKFRVVFIYRDEPFEPNTDKYWKQWGKKWRTARRRALPTSAKQWKRR